MSRMESLYLLIPLSVLVALAGGLVFWWSSRAGQFDDLEGPAHRVLQDDDAPITATTAVSVDAPSHDPAASSSDAGAASTGGATDGGGSDSAGGGGK
jgi:cbb3-type cytochrome oxidase maturation protein